MVTDTQGPPEGGASHSSAGVTASLVTHLDGTGDPGSSLVARDGNARVNGHDGHDGHDADAALEGNLTAVLAAIADAVVIVDSAGYVQYANPSAIELLGRGALVGQEFGFPVIDGERTEVDLLRPGHPAVVAEMRAVAMRWNGRRAYCASLRDVTDRKRAEEQRVELAESRAAQRQAEEAVIARDEFLSVAAHELKTPVTSLRLGIQLTSRQLEPGRTPDLLAIRQRLEGLNAEAGKLTRLVTDLLDVSRVDRGRLTLERQQVDLVPIVRQVVSTVARIAHAHTLTLDAPGSVIAMADPLRIEQVVANLVENAVKFSPQGGPVNVSLTGVSGDATRARLCVRDWGLGIPENRRRGLFSRFYQAHPGSTSSGLGLGLYISRQIVELHGGAISATFPEDGGTQFEVLIPRE